MLNAGYTHIKRRRSPTFRLTIFLCFLIGPLTALAQSHNYWSWNFNTTSTLLSGAVVGGSAGPSAVYYNPALIDHEKIPTLSLSASLVSLQFFNADNIAGEGIDANKFILKIQPRFISYVLHNKNDRLGMELAVLSPVSEEIEYRIQHFDELDIIQRMQGLETYSGYLKYSRKYDDTWIGFGASYKINEQLYLGMSSFLSVKVLKYSFRKRAQAFQLQDSVIIEGIPEPRYIADNSLDEEIKYWNLSFIFKGGVQYKSKNDRLNIGLNLTFPNIRFIGQADIRKAVSRSNVYDNSVDAFTANDIYIVFERKARTLIKTPFATAFGLQYYSQDMDNFVSFTFEYFHEIDPYFMFDVENSGGEVYFTNLIDENKFISYSHAANRVTNAAIGAKRLISEKIVLFGGIRTDFTSGVKDDARFLGERLKVNQVHMDKFHFTIGPVISFKKFNMITGVQYTLGRNSDLDPIVNYADPQEYIPETGQSLEGLRQNEANARLNEFALFFGLTLGFSDQ